MYSSSDNSHSDLDFHLKSIREKYEERLSGMTDRIRAILDDVKQDEVIATMKDDPASAPYVRARMREIAETRFGQEKEETIEKLMKELVGIKGENQRLEREISTLRTSARSLEDQLRQERAKTDSTDRELRDLRSKNDHSGRQYEDNLRRVADETNASLKLAQSEAEKLREKLEQSERSVWLKASEIEMLKHDLESEKSRSSKVLVENSSLKRAYQELEGDYSKVQNSMQSSSGNSNELVQKLALAMKEIASLESSIQSYEREKEELKGKYLAYSREFKEVLESEQKSTSDTIESMQQQHKAKCSLFKKKVIEQKAKIKGLEIDNSDLKSELDATRESYEQSMDLMQSDLRRIRDEWERKCQEVELSANKHLLEVQNKHKSQLASMQQVSQTSFEEKAKEMKDEFDKQIAKQKQAESDLKKVIDERSDIMDKEYIRVSKHESILIEEMNKLKSAIWRSAEEQLTMEFSKKLSVSKEEHEIEVQKLTQRLRNVEELEELASTNKRKTERELEYANERLETLTSKITALNSELTEIETNKKAVMRHLEESGVNIAKLKAMYEDESTRRKATDEQFAVLRDKSKQLEAVIAQKDTEFQQQLHALKLKSIEETTKLQEAIEREQALTRKQMNEIQKLRESHETLHLEKRELYEYHAKTAEELKQNSIKIKQEGASRYELEVAAHRETRIILDSKNQQIDSLMLDIEDLRRSLTEEFEKSVSLKREIEALDAKFIEKYTESQRLLSEKDSLSSTIARNKKSYDTFRTRARKAIKSLTQDYQFRLNSYQKSLQTDLMEFKKFMSKQVSESIAGIEDLQLKQRRATTLALLSKEDLIRAAEKDKQRCEQQLNESIESQTQRYESHIDALKSSLTQLKGEVASKNLEIAAFMQKINDFQLEQERLQEENHSLQSDLQTTLQELEYSKGEESRMKVSFQEEVSGREASMEEKYKRQLVKLEELVGALKTKNEENMVRFQEDVRQLQSRHKDESTELESKYMRKIDEIQRDSQFSEHRRQSLCDSIEEITLELTNLKIESARQLDALEDEISDLVSSLRSDQEKYAQYRQEKTAELEEFGRRLKLITRELQEKDETLERTNRDKETLRNQLKEIRDSQMQREISDLRGSVEKSATVAGKLKRGEIGKSDDEPGGEKPAEGRKIPLSLTQLKASLDKYA